ncbi:MAG: hypothetical protein FIA97_14450, partial [Methylococcaceae bacterium]|nr:hypothetical protein [Methylococcaceae bacterium]
MRSEVVQFTNVASSDSTLQLAADGSDLILKYGSGDQISITNQLYGTNYSVTGFQFTDLSLTADELLASHVLDGGVNGDTINVGVGNNTVNGGAGNDNIHAGDGNAQVFGDANDDYLYGGNGDDTIGGGDGVDHLYGEA